MQRIKRQAETFTAAGQKGDKVVHTPEERGRIDALIAELEYLREQGETIEFDAAGMTRANEIMNRQRDEREWNEVDWGFDKAYNDFLDQYPDEPDEYRTAGKASVLNAAEQGLDAGGYKWLASCDTHGTLLNCRTKKDAQQTNTADFCDECREER